MSNNIIPANAQNNSLQNSRTPIDSTILYPMVDDVLVDWIKQRHTFTAYGVTLQLRLNEPNLEIVHSEVQQRVHDVMNRLHTQGLTDYDVEYRPWGNPPNHARTYFPKFGSTQLPPVLQSAQVQVTTPPTPQLPNGVTVVWDDEDDEPAEPVQ